MGIIDLEGKVFVSYTYNGFGEPSIDVQTEGMTLNDLVVASKLKDHNIYIYKGYIYDQDTKMYYLNSRYYDPSIGRFITPDDPSYLSVENINGLNLYAYCGNNPVMYSDLSGKFFITSLVIAAVGTIIYAGMYTAIDGMLEASKTAKEFGYEKWELVGYALSGSVAGNYFVVKDNWDAIQNMVDWGYNSRYDIIDFSFVNNKYYNFRTAGLFSDYIYNNYYNNNPHRTAAGIYWELQLHYAFYKSPMNWFFPNGREAWIDYNPSVGEPVSRFSEWLGRIFG